MNQPESPDDNQASLPEQGIRQEADNSTFGSGQQAAIGKDNIQNQGDNNWLGNTFNFFFGQQTTAPIGDPARPKNERILLASVKSEVTARLSQSLHNAVLINLGKESQPQQVKRPWDAEIKIGLKPAVPLPDTTTNLEVFDSQEIAGKLLILGAPGAGKTTTQLELAQALVKRAEEQPDYPVPVLFNLSSWKDDRQSLTDWLVAELKSKYGVSIKLGKDWVDNQQLLPLLDGLDELEPQRQELCVYKINELLASETRPFYLVVCSRSEEYNNYCMQLQLNGAIYLQPLTTNQICDYLTSINSIELWSTIRNDLDFLELVKTPLLLSITILVSQEISIEEWQLLNSTENRIQYLLDAYVGRMLTRNINSKAYWNKKIPNARKTRIWLVWLAQQLPSHITEFTVENIVALWYNKIFSTIDSDSKPFQMLNSLLLNLTTGVSVIPFVLINVLIDVHILPIYPWTVSILINYLIFGLDKSRLFLSTSLISSEMSYQIKNYDYDISFKKAIWNTVVYSAYFGIIKGIISGIISGITSGLFLGISGLFSGLFSGLIIGLILGLTFGAGTSCVLHFNKRLFLYLNSYTPWNYARFLDYSTERLFLQRVGGRYRFVHKLLQDHFAQMEFKRD